MSMTAQLVYSAPDRLRYKIVACEESPPESPPDLGPLTIPNVGGATPDLLTDILTAVGPGVSGLPLKELIDAGRDGIYQIAAGACTAAQAIALFLSDDNAGVVFVNNIQPRAVTEMVNMPDPVAPANEMVWSVYWSVDGNHNPQVSVWCDQYKWGEAYLDIHLRTTLDL